MQDEPAPVEILAAVAAFLRDQVAPATAGMLSFQARVTANAVDLVARQIALDGADAEGKRLRALLGLDGSVDALNAALAAAIADGGIDPADPAVAAHLRAITLAKLAVDQPNYSGARAAKET